MNDPRITALSEALHNYWHTDAWQSASTKEIDMGNHYRNAAGIFAALNGWTLTRTTSVSESLDEIERQYLAECATINARIEALLKEKEKFEIESDQARRNLGKLATENEEKLEELQMKVRDFLMAFDELSSSV